MFAKVDQQYRVLLVVADMGWVDFEIWPIHFLPCSAWAVGNLAELAV